MELDDTYWSNRYEKDETGWDMQQASPPLKNYIDQLDNPGLSILIPGCGNAWEAEYLLQKGFQHITLLDISKVLVSKLSRKLAGYPVRILHGDFFEHNEKYDLILEQTFFCALHPSYRPQYALKMHSLLAGGGTLAGVLFNRAFEGGPPFGGNINEYQHLFSTHFHIKTLEPCYNSIPQRASSEAFLILKKAF